eukprot:TRINITY_DN4142_c0_g1_i1.p1 TRINITY_DN4142_c0_g1~~TRINITY_DN4142_c0_g1_i1.p1  ORF type:complete len:373 (+),score=75.55 TRINITY_DN4142_c0_g1_i1:142-1260(+)
MKLSNIVAAFLVNLAASEELATENGVTAAYEQFRAQHGRTEAKSSTEYKMRLSLFAKTKAKVEAHNARKGVSWKASVNKFADFTHEEFQTRLGFRRIGKWWENRPENQKQSSFLQINRKIASSVDLRTKLKSSSFIRDQGACGSCWAVATVGVLEMHAEINTNQTKKLSFKELVDCVPNKQHCGGEGGCKGATSELALQYVQEHGLSENIGYMGNIEQTGACHPHRHPVAKVSQWIKLPENKLMPLMDAVSNDGPVAISVDAGPWSSYSEGVFADCDKDATINHAVVLLGYGSDKESKMDYWLIRNSWGPDWGEAGFIRLQRHADDKGDAGHCGTDHDPKQGTACDGGPASIPVCGMCGMLSDSAYPKEVKF